MSEGRARVEVRYFAAAREAAGREAEEIEVAAGSTVDALLEHLLARHPRLGPLRGSLRVAVRERFAPGQTTLSDGDTVALLPPVSGG